VSFVDEIDSSRSEQRKRLLSDKVAAATNLALASARHEEAKQLYTLNSRRLLKHDLHTRHEELRQEIAHIERELEEV
jgi:hypothetical protein